ncbi:MAG TPA: TIGR04211 family SH3 domain-containing protein [Desulfocapsa sulfexigens]|nr:TIGR04211 family SH3 domain-containing protein [Desulfocapsa sulfexigens]
MLYKHRPNSTEVLFNILLLITILFSATIAIAQTRYIKPSSEIVVRRGQGNEFKIIAMVKDGVAVEFLEASDTHARIRLANGKEGWILKRFLSDEEPLEAIVASLRTENEALIQKEIDATLKFDAVSATLSQTEQELDSILSERDQLKADYLQLQKDTENAVQLKNNLQKSSKNNKILSQNLAALQQENDRIKDDVAFKWFLAGGGVLVFGMLIGSIFTKSRKRRPSLL